MRDSRHIAVIIPALDEALAIAGVVKAVPAWVDEIIVVDNGSCDRTSSAARAAGARVVREPRKGYGTACLAGIKALVSCRSASCDLGPAPCDLVVFLDGDGSDFPEQMGRLVDPIIDGRAELVIGSRTLGTMSQGALQPHQRWGNALACSLLKIIGGPRFTDLGPFRAIRWDCLQGLQMADPTFGWTIEMQIKAVRHGLAVREVPVDYRARIGQSKISGTLAGSCGAAWKILSVLAASFWGELRRG
ncbi:MAG: glycosyltransferase family 2 protein [Pseudomonadota bacterium]